LAHQGSAALRDTLRARREHLDDMVGLVSRADLSEPIAAAESRRCFMRAIVRAKR
jgi:hypothetical protein